MRYIARRTDGRLAHLAGRLAGWLSLPVRGVSGSLLVMADVAMPDGRAVRSSAQAAGSWTTILRGCYRELTPRVAGGRRLEIQI